MSTQNPVATGPSSLRSAALLAVLAIGCSGAAHAALIVDTGVPTSTGFPTSLFNTSPTFQSLGGQFTLSGGATTISEIDGWIKTTTAGNVTVSLWSGAPTVNAIPLFSTAETLTTAAASWQAFDGLAWTVAPGTYTVTFSGGAGYRGSMQGGAPQPLATYYYMGTANPDWVAQSTLGLGLRVTSAVPEPQSAVLLLAGVIFVGSLLARRRLRQPGFAGKSDRPGWGAGIAA